MVAALSNPSPGFAITSSAIKVSRRAARTPKRPACFPAQPLTYSDVRRPNPRMVCKTEGGAVGAGASGEGEKHLPRHPSNRLLRPTRPPQSFFEQALGDGAVEIEHCRRLPRRREDNRIVGVDRGFDVLARLDTGRLDLMRSRGLALLGAALVAVVIAAQVSAQPQTTTPTTVISIKITLTDSVFRVSPKGAAGSARAFPPQQSRCEGTCLYARPHRDPNRDSKGLYEDPQARTAGGRPPLPRLSRQDRVSRLAPARPKQGGHEGLHPRLLIASFTRGMNFATITGEVESLRVSPTPTALSVATSTVSCFHVGTQARPATARRRNRRHALQSGPVVEGSPQGQRQGGERRSPKSGDG